MASIDQRLPRLVLPIWRRPSEAVTKSQVDELQGKELSNNREENLEGPEEPLRAHVDKG